MVGGQQLRECSQSNSWAKQQLTDNAHCGSCMEIGSRCKTDPGCKRECQHTAKREREVEQNKPSQSDRVGIERILFVLAYGVDAAGWYAMEAENTGIMVYNV